MKDLCRTQVRPDDEGYYILQMFDWAPKDSSATMRARWLNLSYMAKFWDDSQAASEFGQRVLHPMLVNDLYTLSSEILMAQAARQITLGHHQMALLDRVHDAGRLVTLMGNQASHLKAKIAKLKTEGDPELLTVARQQMAELQADNAKLRSELGIVCLIKEQKADDELLSLMRENEALKAELPSKSIADYKQSARYPNLEVDIDPFTEKPEDSSVPMKTRQEFDDSIPPEE
ncbi:hypothetical protein BHM03_00005529 [Ensete ventricosum]|nr:hypothetical protein BHM03_00005529 [Ensete ventricosum]